jgi:hypothetical protein
MLGPHMAQKVGMTFSFDFPWLNARRSIGQILLLSR